MGSDNEEEIDLNSFREGSACNEEITQECHCCKDVNRHLLPPKLFYFFFFAANGTLMPYLVLFFKQLGLTPSQVGIVTGFKPFMSFICTPVWGYIADKYKKTKWIYIISLLAYIGGYFAYSFAPAKHVCKLRTNSTKHHQPFGFHSHVHKRNIESSYKLYQILHKLKSKRNIYTPKQNTEYLRKHKKKHIRDVGTINSDYQTFPDEGGISFFQLPAHLGALASKGKGKVLKTNTGLEKENFTRKDSLPFYNDEPSWTSDISEHRSPWGICAAARANSEYETNFSAEIKAIVDMKAIFTYLLIVTIVATIFSCALITVVDTATIRKLQENNETHKYGKQRLWGSLGWGITSFGVGAIISLIPLCPGMNNEVNYYPAFYVFAVLLLFALVIGLRLQFNPPEQVESDDVQISHAQKIKNGLKLLKDPVYFCFIATSFYIGIVMSIIKTFLFWHLKDIGGTQLLFSIAAAINCVSEVFVYFCSSLFIQRIGHIKVLYIALVCYSMRLFYYGLLTNPWYVLAAEPLSGITTAAAWASMTSYIGLHATPESVTTLQGILHGIHWGLGHGCGELLGGFMVSWIGGAMTFNVFGALTLLQLLIFMSVNYCSQKRLTKNINAKLSEQNTPLMKNQVEE
ncbi:major facilitator superfamily domain-containing protein 6-like [Hydractinia symbiolongicarpus]|uniref:major facilitator superfamily domain-containing protein 6-like n=1 Tax=Hydractinia symbiolongicarpus TaxID=13093 RepID=UPI00254F0F66|nr:major facilitator superfamily domain-containing protein 6-like [Hydractinia symbiolongicarpus]